MLCLGLSPDSAPYQLCGLVSLRIPSELQFPHLYNGEKNCTHFTEMSIQQDNTTWKAVSWYSTQ